MRLGVFLFGIFYGSKTNNQQVQFTNVQKYRLPIKEKFIMHNAVWSFCFEKYVKIYLLLLFPVATCVAVLLPHVSESCNPHDSHYLWTFEPHLIPEGTTCVQWFTISTNPSFQFSHLSGCTEMNFIHTNTKEVVPDAWCGFNNLRTLRIMGSRILTDLTENMFEHLISLGSLNLCHNSISRIHSGAWNDLSSLNSIGFADNKIRILETDMFLGLSSLTSLELTNNLIFKIDQNAFNGLASLTTLSFKNNQIAAIQPLAWKDLTAINSLNLDNQDLTALDTNTFLSLSFLQSLSGTRNQITIIHFKAFNGLFSLEMLSLSSNAVTTTEPGAWNDLKFKLTNLYLGYNKLKVLYSGMFMLLTVLKELDLRSNDIYIIKSEAFSGFPNLKELIFL